MTETIFCNKCGQANLRLSESCSKCGNVFQNANTIKPQETKEKNNTKIYLILGGVGVVILLGVFLMGIFGIGAYLYISAKNNQPKVNNPAPVQPQQPKVTGVEPKNSPQTKMTEEDVRNYLNQKLKVVGKYQLSKTGKPNPFFIGSNAEQFGFYNSDNKKDWVLLVLAEYSSIVETKTFAANKIAEVNKKGGKITYYKDFSDGFSVIYEMEKGVGQIIDCQNGICFNILASSGKDTSEFYKALKGGK